MTDQPNRFGRIRPPVAAWLAKTCIERFGPARCMFETNFPVEKMGIGYAARTSAEEKRALFSGTARRAYRLD